MGNEGGIQMTPGFLVWAIEYLDSDMLILGIQEEE